MLNLTTFPGSALQPSPPCKKEYGVEHGFFYLERTPPPVFDVTVVKDSPFPTVVATVKDRRLFLQSFYTFPQLLTAVIGAVNGC